MGNNRKPPPAMRTPPNAQQQEELKKKLSGLFNREKPYTPIAKSLAAANIQPRVMFIDIGDTKVECLVIPVQEMIFKEWIHMTGGIDNPIQPEAPEVNEVRDGDDNVVSIHEERDNDDDTE